MANEDRDLSSIDALDDPDAGPTKLSTELETLPAEIRATRTAIDDTATGKTPSDATAATVDAENAARDAATAAAIKEQAVRILKAAAAAWRKNAPKKMDFDAAEKELADARKQMADASEASGDTSAASKRVEDALAQLRKITAERKAADEALDRELEKAAAAMKRITGDKDRTQHDGDGTGVTLPGQSTGNGRSSGEVGTGTAPGAAKPGSGTPGAAKPAGTPAETTTSTPTSKPDPGIASLLSTLGQQSAAQPNAAQQATPAAAAPQQNQQRQQGQNKKTPGVIDVDDLIREGALPASAAVSALGLGGSPSPSSSAPTPTPAAQQASTTLRPDFKPASLAAAAAQNPVTSGQSATGLTTPSDVGGRSTPTPGAFDSPRTSTSAAHTDTAQQQGTQQQGRPTTGTGMPVMPMTPMTGGAPAPRSGDGENRPGVVRYQDGEIGRHGEEALKEATPGGTIAQNRDNPAA